MEEKSGDYCKLVDRETELLQRFCDLIFDCFWRDVELLCDLFIWQRLHPAEIKNLTTSLRKAVNTLLEHVFKFGKRVVLRVFRFRCQSRKVFQMPSTDTSGTEVHEAFKFNRLIEVCFYIVDFQMTSLLPEGNKNILNDIFCNGLIFHNPASQTK